jgi:glucose 1-dehydrogenase
VRFEGRSAVVTGAGFGNGRAIARRLAAEGARVLVADVDHDRAAATCALIGEAAFACTVDVRSRLDVERMMTTAIERLSRVDVLVSNAGINRHVPFVDLTDEDWDAIMDVNLRGTWLCGQAAARHMIETGGGAIVNIASTNSVIVPFAGLSAYSASKGAVAMLTKAMALELVPYGIRVNAVAPGLIRTGMTSTMLEDEDRLAEFRARIPLGRPGEPEDVAAAVAYLASDEAAYAVGTILYLDGGRLIV